ncbi:MAG: GNAT family N-acetyltransferase [Burkholderiaceae bacterium]
MDDGPEIQLRLAVRADAVALAEMSRDWIESGLGWTYRPERVRRLITHRETLTVVAGDGDQRIGFAAMQFGDDRAHLVLMAVTPAWRRRGVGRALLQWLVDSALAAGMASLHLELRDGNADAQAFYVAMGFSPTLRVAGYYQGREHAVRMVRVLRDPLAAVSDDWLSALRR